MNNSYALHPKKYKYNLKFLSLNEAIIFLKNQIDTMHSLKNDLLIKYKALLKSNFSNNTNAIIISNDISLFIIEYNKALSNLYKDLNRVSKGVNGEDKVREIIYTFDSEWKILSNASLFLEGNKIENDFIIIDETGITTIEVKNIGNHSNKLLIDKLGRVTIVNSNRNYDMIAQGNRHLGYLNKFALKNFQFKVPIYQLIVITSDIKITNESNFPIIGPNQIYKTIKSKPQKLNFVQVNTIYNTLLNNLVECSKYQYTEYSTSIVENYSLIIKSLKELLVKN